MWEKMLVPFLFECFLGSRFSLVHSIKSCAFADSALIKVVPPQ